MLIPKSLLIRMKPYYERRLYTPTEYEDDVGNLVAVIRYCRKWKRGQHINKRKMINHIIIFLNMFSAESVKQAMYYAEETDTKKQLNSLLCFINRGYVDDEVDIMLLSELEKELK